jgi:hypothetical protein
MHLARKKNACSQNFQRCSIDVWVPAYAGMTIVLKAMMALCDSPARKREGEETGSIKIHIV